MSNSSNEQPKESKTIISFKNSFWLVIILVFLFIGALNFIKAESGSEEENKGEGKEKTEMKATEPAGGENAQKAEEVKSAADSTKKDTATKAGM